MPSTILPDSAIMQAAIPGIRNYIRRNTYGAQPNKRRKRFMATLRLRKVYAPWTSEAMGLDRLNTKKGVA
jgi:hypothetical protein